MVEYLRAWQIIAGEIVANGGMATKSLCEDRLMAQFGIDSYTAHEITNSAQHYNVLPYHPEKIRQGGLWARELITEETLNQILR